VDVVLWDVGGSEKYRHSRKLYYKDIDSILLVYDTTNLKTYYNLRKWMFELTSLYEDDANVLKRKQQGNNKTRTKVDFLRSCPVLIVGTKLDLAPKSDQPTKLQHDWKCKAVYLSSNTYTTDRIKDSLDFFWSGGSTNLNHQSAAVRRRRVSDKFY